jgi:hypothetical protein
VVPFHRSESLKWYAAVLFGALSTALFVAAPQPASAGIFDFLFGGAHEQAAPPPVDAYAEPGASTLSVAPVGGTGRFVAFCVRLCDGQHFPLAHMANATPVETCRAMCPASKTKVFFGSEIDHAVAQDGGRYANLDNAFVYRQRLVPKCTCNGKDAFGLARFDLSSDPTLRPGDIVATKDGFVAYAGKRGQANAFMPVDAKAITAELSAGSSRVRLARRNTELAVIDESPGVTVPQPRTADVQTAR